MLHGQDGAQTFVRKVKLFKKPKFDLGALLALHGELTGADDSGKPVEREFKEQVLGKVQALRRE